MKDSLVQVVFYALKKQDRPTFGILSNQCLSHICSVANTTENFSETKFRRKKSKFLVCGKIPIIQFSYMENAYHRVFIQFSVRMELYEKKFLIYGKLYDKKFWSTRVDKELHYLDRFHKNSLLVFELVQYNRSLYTKPLYFID